MQKTYGNPNGNMATAGSNSFFPSCQDGQQRVVFTADKTTRPRFAAEISKHTRHEESFCEKLK